MSTIWLTMHLVSDIIAGVASIAAARRTKGSSVDAADAVATAIRDGIMGGGLAPHQRLVESELAAELSASRAAVRVALLRLANEGLVERSRYRGARVREVSVAEAIEITEVRMAIEALCAQKAAMRADDRRLAALEDVGRRMRAAAESGDLAGYSALNQELHRQVTEMSGHSTAAAEIERLRAQSVRHEYRLSLIPGRARVSLREHERIIEAIRARDEAAAESAMRAHLISVVDALSASRPGSRRSSDPEGSG
jgi:DNA-binding GntR family transcriptional regulator